MRNFVVFSGLAATAQFGVGARRSRRLGDQKHEARGTPGPLAFFTLKRRERRAPLAQGRARRADCCRFRPVAKADNQEVANEIISDRQISLVLAKAAAGAVVVLAVAGRHTAGESPASDPVEFIMHEFLVGADGRRLWPKNNLCLVASSPVKTKNL